jgi:hypothetical protein
MGSPRQRVLILSAMIGASDREHGKDLGRLLFFLMLAAMSSRLVRQ